MLAFLNAPSDAVESNKVKIPTLSEETLSMMIERVQSINSETETVTIADFQDSIAAVRESLVASINGADSASGDDYLPLFCYVIMKGMPMYLPSQLQTAKVISQRKEQDKYFIDCCVAMKALRNFCNVLFKTEHDEQTTNGQSAMDTTPGNMDSVNADAEAQRHEVQQQQQQQHQEQPEEKAKSNGNTKSSLFNALRSKLPQRTPKSNGNLFNNLSPSNFMNKRMSPQSSASPKETKESEEAQQSQHSQPLQPAPAPPPAAPDQEQAEQVKEAEQETESEANLVEDKSEENDVMVQVSAKLN